MAFYISGIPDQNTNGQLYLPTFGAARMGQIRFAIVCNNFNDASPGDGTITLSGFSGKEYVVEQIPVFRGSNSSVVINCPPDEIRVRCSRQGNFSYAVWGVPLRDAALPAAKQKKYTTPGGAAKSAPAKKPVRKK